MVAPSRASAATIRQRFGSLSKAFVLPICDAKRIPPSCPIKSFMTQLRAPDTTAASLFCPTIPTASNRVCVDSTIAADPATEAMKQKEAKPRYPGATLWGYRAGSSSAISLLGIDCKPARRMESLRQIPVVLLFVVSHIVSSPCLPVFATRSTLRKV
ncbi:unnamed protein product [Pseudo-nitzschia multistriata]|uniref:Uncharacterized protein n=1 Tax=Pseudo-nitzschia multistriata TaxID=183589 RepID=A0A448ZB90_9STRA|nr:unnamed protein product [Pseudo-nitzschia multistriata]